jgi:hypothetical protein
MPSLLVVSEVAQKRNLQYVPKRPQKDSTYRSCETVLLSKHCCSSVLKQEFSTLQASKDGRILGAEINKKNK